MSPPNRWLPVALLAMTACTGSDDDSTTEDAANSGGASGADAAAPLGCPVDEPAAGLYQRPMPLPRHAGAKRV